MEQLTGGSLFTGLGGFDLGLERAGIRIVWQCERDPYCRAVLAGHWPGIPCYPDVRGLVAIAALHGRRSRRAGRLVGSRPRETQYPLPDAVDVLFGGFPCQPTSAAGRQKGRNDDRWLWPVFARLVGLLRPRYVFLENPPGLLRREFGDVLGDLAQRGYDAEWQSVPASALGAPHQRDRVWLVAYPNGDYRGAPWARQVETWPANKPEPGGQPLAHAAGPRLQERNGLIFSEAPSSGPFGEPLGRGQWAVEPAVGRVADGVPSRVDRLRALGNAVVPQVAEWGARQIVAYHTAAVEAATRS